MRLKKNIAVSESGFLFDPTTGESFNLNKTGQFLVKLLAEGKTENEATDLVLQKYDVEETTFQRYFDDFLMMLKQYNLTEEGDE